MATTHNSKEIKFGFEFETLALAKSNTLAKLQELDSEYLKAIYCDKENSNAVSNSYIVPRNGTLDVPDRRRDHVLKDGDDMDVDDENTEPVKFYRDDYVQRVFRFYLRDRLNNLDSKETLLTFKANHDYGMAACPSKNNYAITHDPSVHIDQYPQRRIPFYTDLKTTYLDVNPSSLDVVEHIEYVSPPITITNLAEVVEAIKRFGLNGEMLYFNNSTTSNHIHYSAGNELMNPINLGYLCSFWLYFEPLFMYLVPHWRRYNEYAESMFDCMVRTAGNETKVQRLMFGFEHLVEQLQKDSSNGIWKVISVFQGDPSKTSTRYASFNMLNMLPDKIGTVEVRIKHGSTDAEELIMYIKLFARLIAGVLVLGESASSFITKYISVTSKRNARLTIWTAAESYANSKTTNASENISKLLPIFNYFLDISGVSETFENWGVSERNINLLKQYIPDYTKESDTVLYTWMTNQFDFINKEVNPNMQVLTTGGARLKRTKPANSVYLFSYSSNSSQQLRKRLGLSRAPVAIRGMLKNHCRVFGGKSAAWDDGAVASIVPKKNAVVVGAVFEMTREQLEALDKFESGYTREKRTVYIGDSNKRTIAYVYVKKNVTWKCMPSLGYLRAIHATMKDIGVRDVIPVCCVQKQNKEGARKRVEEVGSFNPSSGKLKAVIV